MEVESRESELTLQREEASVVSECLVGYRKSLSCSSISAAEVSGAQVKWVSWQPFPRKPRISQSSNMVRPMAIAE